MDAFLYELHQNKLFRAIDVPATLREQKQKYAGGESWLKWLHCIKLILAFYQGEWCSAQENSPLERSFVLGFPQTRPGSLSKGLCLAVESSCAQESSKRLNSGLNYPLYNLWFLLLSDFNKINVFPTERSAWQIWWKYFHNFRRNVQCRAVSCPPAGLKLRAQIWLFLRIISQCQLSRGPSIKSGCSIYWVSWTKQI